MARYIQRIALLGKERWIGWEIDGVGTEVPGLTLADEIPEAELRALGVREFQPLDFETFLGMNPEAGRAEALRGRWSSCAETIAICAPSAQRSLGLLPSALCLLPFLE